MGDVQIFNALIEFFEEDEWDFQWLQGLPVLSLGFGGRNGNWTCYAQAREPQQQFVFYSVVPVNAPADKLPALAEFITRANYGMILGNFEMDYEDGEVRYKTSVDVEGSALTPAMIRQMVYANVIIMDRYLPGIMRVIYGSFTPLEALESVEDDFRDGPKAMLSDSDTAEVEGVDDADLDEDDDDTNGFLDAYDDDDFLDYFDEIDDYDDLDDLDELDDIDDDPDTSLNGKTPH